MVLGLFLRNLIKNYHKRIRRIATVENLRHIFKSPTLFEQTIDEVDKWVNDICAITARRRIRRCCPRRGIATLLPLPYPLLPNV